MQTRAKRSQISPLAGHLHIYLLAFAHSAAAGGIASSAAAVALRHASCCKAARAAYACISVKTPVRVILLPWPLPARFMIGCCVGTRGLTSGGVLCGQGAA